MMGWWWCYLFYTLPPPKSVETNISRRRNKDLYLYFTL